MQFVKMHGAGNDYVYVDCVAASPPANPSQLARRISDRNFGVGGDGLILVLPAVNGADARMRMFNADGSEAEMCGNGLRCVGKYVYESGIARKRQLNIETGAGPLQLDLIVEGEQVTGVKIDMGEPILDPGRVPTTLRPEPEFEARGAIDIPLTIDRREFRATCVSMGNPHCVVFVEQATDELVLGVGPKIEVADCFPARTNVEFVEVISRTELRQRTWERGSGETLACGTGACAVCVAGVLTGQSDRQVVIHLSGGDLELNWDEDTNHVFMTGPAEEVFRGTWPHG